MEFDDALTRLVRRDQEMIACPYPLFEELQREAPVRFSDELGAYVVTRYDDVRAILHDTDTWSSVSPTGPGTRGSELADNMMELMAEPEMAELAAAVMSDRRTTAVLLNADPPEHVRQRIAMNAAFRPKRIRGMEGLVQSTSDELMATFAGRGTVEFVGEYAVLLPMTIIAVALGVPVEDIATFKRWSDDMVMPVGNASPSLEQTRDYLRSSKEFGDFFTEMLRARRTDPTEDIISDVATAAVDGEELSEAEKLSALTQFLVAGNETTTKLLTNIAYRFATDPEVRERVAADRSLVETTVEEALRFEAPVGGLFRQAKVDTTVSGVEIPAGEHVWVLYAAANRDESKFGCPADFDPARGNVREHLAFGHGEHFCIGAALARLEAVIATNAMLDHLPNLRLSADHVEEYEDSYVLRGRKSLRLEFDPA